MKIEAAIAVMTAVTPMIIAIWKMFALDKKVSRIARDLNIRLSAREELDEFREQFQIDVQKMKLGIQGDISKFYSQVMYMLVDVFIKMLADGQRNGGRGFDDLQQFDCHKDFLLSELEQVYKYGEETVSKAFAVSFKQLSGPQTSILLLDLRKIYADRITNSKAKRVHRRCLVYIDQTITDIYSVAALHDLLGVNTNKQEVTYA